MRSKGCIAMIAAASFTTAVVALGVAPASAGEITGNGRILKQEDGTLHGRSECAFSGLNDQWGGDPAVPGEDGFFRTQSWGQIPKVVRDQIGAQGSHPGDACNPNNVPVEP